MKALKCFYALLATEMIVVLAGFGIAAWMFAQVPDPKNVLAMVPICFLGFSILVTIFGLLAAKCRNTFTLIVHISFGAVCLIGFGLACILTGMWLGGKNIFPNLEDLDRSTINLACNNETVFSAVENDTIDELQVEEEILTKLEAAREVLKDYLNFCRMEQVAMDLIFGRTDESTSLTVNVIIAICAFCGGSFLLYMATGILGCMFMKDIKNYGWTA